MDLGGVRAQSHQMLWSEDLGPETPVDNADIPQPTRPENNQDVVDVSSDSDDGEWKYVKGNVESSEKDAMDESLSDQKSQLNPNATEFVPGVSSVEKDEFIASSPNIGKVSSKNLDDIDVPSESEFNREIATKACELEDSFNDIVEHSSRREIDFTSGNDEVQNASVTLILNPHSDHSDSEIKSSDSNPFAADMETIKDETDKVNFVQNYFAQSEVDIKSSECVSGKTREDDQFESQIPNSVSAEISCHFNFIDSHLDKNEMDRQEESEKERNQLEIKEPESPVNSEHVNGIIRAEFQVPAEVVEKHIDLENETTSPVNTSQPEDIPSNNVNAVMSETASDQFICESDKLNITDSEDMFRFESQEDVQAAAENESNLPSKILSPSPAKDYHVKSNPFHSDLQVENVSNEFVTSNFMEEVATLTNLPLSEQLKPTCENDNDKEMLNFKDDFYHENVHDSDDIPRDKQEDLIPQVAEISNEKEKDSYVCDTGKILSENDEVSDVINDGQEKEPLANLEETDQPHLNEIVSNGGNQEIITDIVKEVPHESDSTPDVEVTQESNDLSNGDERSEPTVELADTIGPNSFSFSQPNRVVFEQCYYIEGMTAIDLFNRYGTADIMMTSMHESLEPDSSFECINDLSAKDSNHPGENVDKKDDNVTPSVDQPADNADDLINGVNFESHQVNENVTAESLTVESETECAVVESHAMPVSSEPDLVFVEQICPTVEVQSDEASPVNKENDTLGLSTTAITAIAAAAAAGTAVALAPKEETQKPLEKEKDTKDAKPESKPATKTATVKKTAPAAAKPSAPKTSSVKSASAKPATITGNAKPKAPATTKPITSTLTKRPAPSTMKSTTVIGSKTAPTSKTLTQNATVPASKAAPKSTTTTTAKSTLTSAKPASRPASAPSKPSAPAATKPPLSSRTSTAAPRAPLASKKTTTSTVSRPLGSSRPATVTETIASAKPSTPRASTLSSTKSATTKPATTLGARPPTKLGLSSAPTAKPKTASSLTKPAPIKAKAPLAGSKKPAAATAKKASTVLDKNTKNAVKPVPKETAQKDTEPEGDKNGDVHESHTTNGHHFANGNATPHDQTPSPLII